MSNTHSPSSRLVCPACRAEYRAGVSRCSDCDAALVVSDAPVKPPRPNILGMAALIAYPLIFALGVGKGYAPIDAALWSAKYGSLLFVGLFFLGRFIYRKRLRDLEGEGR